MLVNSDDIKLDRITKYFLLNHSTILASKVKRFLSSINISAVYTVPPLVSMPGHRVSETTSVAHFHHIFFPRYGDWLSQYQPVNDGVH